MSSLHPRTHDVLLSAWRENRLAAIHIDLQTGFKVNDHVLDGVAKLTKALKPLNIDNIWVAYGRHYTDAPNITTNVKGIIDAELPCGRSAQSGLPQSVPSQSLVCRRRWSQVIFLL